MNVLRSIICLSLCGFAVACEDTASAPSDGGGGADGDPIGGESNAGGDAGGGGGDAPADGKVAVTVRSYEGELQAGVHLIANDAAGEIFGEAVTNAAGAAELTVPPGGSVTAAYALAYDAATPPAVGRFVSTVSFAGAAPAAVGFNIHTLNEPQPAPATETLQFVYPPRIGAATYELITSCGSKETTSLAVTLSVPRCTKSGAFDAVVVARDPSGSIIDFAQLNDQLFIAGKPQYFQLQWSGSGAEPITFQVDDVPAGSTVSAGTSARELEGEIGTSVSDSHWIAAASGDVMFPLQHLIGYGSDHCQSLVVTTNVTPLLVVTHTKRRCGATADVSTFNLDLARLTQFDPEAPVLEPFAMSWGVANRGEEGTLLAVEQFWERSESEQGNWSLYLEPTAGSRPFPKLPPSLADFEPRSDDTLGNTVVTHVDDPAMSGFEDAVANGVPNVGYDSLEQVTSMIPD